MRVVVTGGCGFIGSHVVDRLLREKAEVLVLDDFSKGRDHWTQAASKPSIARIDITGREQTVRAIADWRPDTVFHLAAHHFIPFCEGHPAEAYRLNVAGTLNVMEGAAAGGATRFFLASTADVYAPSERPHAESDKVAPFTVYGRTKQICETMMSDLPRFGFRGRVVIGRIFNAVGRRETNPHLVPEVIAQIKRGARQLQVGNLTPTRDFVDVASMGEAIVDVTLLDGGPTPTVVNIGSGESIVVSAMIDLLCEASAVSPTVTVDPAKVRPAERQHLCADTARLRSMIGSTPVAARMQTLRHIFSAPDA